MRRSIHRGLRYLVGLWLIPILAGSAAAQDSAASGSDFEIWQQQTRQQLREMLGIPHDHVPLAAEKRGQFEHDGVVIEKWIFTSEPGSRVPAVLYRPKSPAAPMPAIVFTYGHGCSKSQWAYNYAGLLYAKLGLAVLAIDPLGEEERHINGSIGSRAHDDATADQRATAAGRLIMGKLVFDTMRGIDFLTERSDIDPQHIGVAGYSLGGAVGSWVAALEPRVRLAIVAGWAYGDVTLNTKLCTKVPNTRLLKICTWPEFAALSAPQCALFVMNGDADVIVDQKNDGSAWSQTKSAISDAAKTYQAQEAGEKIATWFESQAGHRPFFAYKQGLEWIHQYLGAPDWTLERIRKLPTINSGQWCDTHGIELEKLYGTELHSRGATLPDLHLTPTSRAALSCLRANEVGTTEFTIEGWLATIEANAH